MSTDNVLNHVRCVDKVSFFTSLNEKQKSYLLSQSITYPFKQGEWLDQLPQGIHIIHEGCIRQVIYQPSGTVHVIWNGKSGDILSENISLKQNNPFHFEAETNGALCIITQESIELLIKEDTTLALNLMKEAYAHIHLLEHRIFTLSIKDTTYRVAQALVDLADHHHQIKQSHQSLGEYCHLSRETVTRKLGILAKEGWIDIHRTYIQVKDIVALKAEIILKVQ